MQDQLIDTKIVYSDGKTTYLNKHLIKQQNLNQKQVDKLKVIHQKKYDVITEMKNTDDIKTLKLLAMDIEVIEFELQKAWGFPENRDFHYWWDIPKCKCDGIFDYGTSVRNIHKNCKIHNDG